VRRHLGVRPEVWVFTGPVGDWRRIFPRRQEREEKYYTYPASQVRIVMSAVQAPAAAEVLGYWRDIVSRFPDDDPLQRPYGGLNFVHPDSVLGCYLAGAPRACHYKCVSHGWTKIGLRDHYAAGKGPLCESGHLYRGS
jgi:hypothetical protein